MILILQFFILSHEKEVIGAVDPYVSAPCNVTTSDSQCCVSQCLCTADNNGRIIKAEVRILSSPFPLLKKLSKRWLGLRSLSRIFKEFLRAPIFAFTTIEQGCKSSSRAGCSMPDKHIYHLILIDKAYVKWLYHLILRLNLNFADKRLLWCEKINCWKICWKNGIFFLIAHG